VDAAVFALAGIDNSRRVTHPPPAELKQKDNTYIVIASQPLTPHIPYHRSSTQQQVLATAAAATAAALRPALSDQPLFTHHITMNMNSAADKENTDPCQYKGRGLVGHNHNNSSNNKSNAGSSPLSPGAAKRKRGQTEQKEQRPPLRDITALPGLTPTFAQPAFDIASDAQQSHQDQSMGSGSSTATTSASSARKKKPAAAKGKEDNSKKAQSSHGKKSGGSGGASSSSSSNLAGTSFFRPLR